MRMSVSNDQMLLPHIMRCSRDQLGLEVGMEVFAQVKNMALHA